MKEPTKAEKIIQQYNERKEKLASQPKKPISKVSSGKKWGPCVGCTKYFPYSERYYKDKKGHIRCKKCHDKNQKVIKSKKQVSYTPPKKSEDEEFLEKLDSFDYPNTDPREVDDEPEPGPLVDDEFKENQIEMPEIDDDFYRQEYEDLVERLAIAKKRYPVEKVWIAVEYEDKLGRMKDIEGVLFFMKWPMLQIETQNDGKWGKTTYVDMRRMEILWRDYKTVDELGYPRKTWKKKSEEPS